MSDPSKLSSHRYDGDVLARPAVARRSYPVVGVALDMVVEERTSGFCGAIVAADRHAIALEDRFGARRSFPYLEGGFLLDGAPVTLRVAAPPAQNRPARTASGSRAVPDARARVARASRILVEGRHDAELVERVWGADLRHEGVVVEPLDGLDHLPAVLGARRPGPASRLGVLADHLVTGSKESRLAAQCRHPHVLVLGHPYVDIWEAVRPATVGIPAWPKVERGTDWKSGICAALGERGGPPALWRRILRAVGSYADLETPLVRAVEELIDFVTAPS